MKTTRASTSQPTLNQRREIGNSLREKCLRSSHAAWKAPANRPNPLRLLEQSNKGRIPGLIPIRYGRMVRTPFTFYRGAALNMAADLADTPATGIRVQACGDCHLLNFGSQRASRVEFAHRRDIGLSGQRPARHQSRLEHRRDHPVGS